jgi:hypothetical protein
MLQRLPSHLNGGTLDRKTVVKSIQFYDEQFRLSFTHIRKRHILQLKYQGVCVPMNISRAGKLHLRQQQVRGRQVFYWGATESWHRGGGGGEM